MDDGADSAISSLLRGNRLPRAQGDWSECQADRLVDAQWSMYGEIVIRSSPRSFWLGPNLPTSNNKHDALSEELPVQLVLRLIKVRHGSKISLG